MKHLSKITMIIVILVCGTVYFYTKNDPILIIGLFIIFSRNDDLQDERATSIRSSAAYWALIVSFLIQQFSGTLYLKEIITFNFNSTNHFLILALGLANFIRYLRQFLLA